MKTTFPLILFGILITLSSTHAEKPSFQPDKAFSLSFVAIGERADAHWTGDKGEMKVHAKNSDVKTPTKLHILNAKGKEKVTSLNMRLNSPSPRFKLMGSTCHLATGKKHAYKKFASVKLPEVKGAYTVFLALNLAEKNWKDPQHLVLSDRVADFPMGTVRIVNLSALPITIEWGEEKIPPLEPGTSKIIKMLPEEADKKTMLISYTFQEKKRIAFRRKLTIPSQQRMNITCGISQKENRPVSARLFSITPL